MSLKQHTTRALVLLFAIVVLTTPLTGLGSPRTADALSGSEFNPGRIIDDSIFFNKDSMRPEQIQAFLDAKIPNCWRNHPSYTGGSGITYNPPFICLKEYQENPTTRENNLGRLNPDGSPYTVQGGKSAAQIIWDAGQAHGINPQVLIVMLQKEQSLVTDDWPISNQFKIAMGYACPDTAPCDTQYFGFYNQVNSAAKQLRRYVTNPDGYNHKAGVTRFIRWNPNASCGGSDVYIENSATAALYNYTPYQPNQAAVNNLYGSGDGCSAYGNRNFWRMFNDWFGTTRFQSITGCQEATNTSIACVWNLRNVVTDEQVLTPSFDVANYFLNNGGYTYLGVNFFTNVVIAPQPGNIPVYRLDKPNGATFLTTSAAERDFLVKSRGYADRGIGFYADPSGSNSGYGVFRLYSESKDKHIWTASYTDRNTLVANGYRDEGFAFTSISPTRQEQAPPAGQQLVYRFNMPNNSHFWTTDVYERDSMIKSGYKYEGIAWNSSSSNSNTPIYRLYSPNMQKHLYTTDENEKNVLSQTGYWQYEGISQYVSKTPNDKPVYRLYSLVTYRHFWTRDAYEKHVLSSTGLWVDEGPGWYQP